MRADLDTTNLEAVSDYAALCFHQGKYTDSEEYYLISLRAYIDIKDTYKVANTQYHLGTVYCFLHDYPNSEKYLKLAIE